MEKNKDKHIGTIGAFLLAIVVQLLIYWRLAILPFGDKTMLVWDMEWQFSAFMSWFSDVLKNEAEFWYSLRGALGGSTVGLFAYYLSSPLNLLLGFADKDTLPYFVSLLLLIKTGLAAGTMQFYLNKRNSGVISVLWGTMYALCSFAVAFQYNTMWMDAFLMLPLVIHGIDLIMDDRQGYVYCVALGICLLCNYYIGYMVCLFCVIYFLAACIDKKFTWKKAGSFAVFSLLGGGVSAAVLIPGGMTLLNSSSGRVLTINDFLDYSLLISPLAEIKYLFAGYFDRNQGILGEYPMLYAGNVVVFLALFFFINKSIGWRTRLRYGVILAILCVGMIFRGPFLIWHGFMMPSGCHERFAFLFVFIALVISYDAISHINKTNFIPLIISGVLAVLMLGAAYIQVPSLVRTGINSIFLICSTVLVCLLVLIPRHFIQQISFCALALFIIGEFVYNGTNIHEAQFSDDNYVKLSAYLTDNSVFNELLAYTTDTNQEECRTVVIHGLGDSFNQGFLRNINSINMYASSENEATWNIYSRYGLGAPDWESEVEYDQFATALASDVLGVRYVIDYSNNSYPGFVDIARSGDLSIYENTDVLPLVFLVNPKSLDTEADSSFDTLNNLYHSLYGADDRNPYVYEEPDADGLDEYQDYEKTKEDRVYLQSDGRYTDGIDIYSEDSELLQSTMMENRIYTKSVKIEKNGISAILDNPDDKLMYACVSVPYDKNWKALVDGKPVEAMSGMGGLVLVPIEAGTHSIRIIYSTPGLTAGAFISGLCIIIMLSLVLYDRVRIKKNGK